MESVALVIIVVLSTQLVAIFGFLLMERRQPAATLAWLLTIIFLPVAGVMLYVLIGVTRLVRHERRSEAIAQRVETALQKFALTGRLVDTEQRFQIPDYRTQALLRLGRNLSKTSTSASTGNRCTLLVNAAATYRAMLEAIDEAEDHIHVQFYIIQPDETGRNLRDRLVERAREGVEVRVLYDAVGSMKLPGDFWAPLHAVGGETSAFGPMLRIVGRLRRRDRVDFRNHRKIVVTDGRIGFTGGINMGREYLGLNPDVGHWRDTHVEIRGPATLSLQKTFVEDWLRATGTLLDEERYFPEPGQTDGDAVVQIIDSGPDRTFSPIYQLYFSTMIMARERLWITSPYFVPDAVIEETLISAALRGVDVRLLLPSKSDLRLVTVASRSYYPKLLEAGVRIYEYGRGFVHAKTLVVDDWVASVGSANMDIRSFHFHYELNAFIFEPEFCGRLAESFLRDLRHAERIDAEAQRRLGYWTRLSRASARLLSPLL